jgi:hypothetical protein
MFEGHRTDITRQLLTSVLATSAYLALTFLSAGLSRSVAAAFIHPAVQEAWSLHYLLTIGTLELIGATVAGLAVAYMALDCADRPRPLLMAIGGITALGILIWPAWFSSAATTVTIGWSVAVHAVTPTIAATALVAWRSDTWL